MALEYYKEAEALNAKNFDADAYNEYGKFIFRFENYNQALICYQKAISINPNNADAYYNIEFYHNLGNYNQAITCLKSNFYKSK